MRTIWLRYVVSASLLLALASLEEASAAPAPASGKPASKQLAAKSSTRAPQRENNRIAVLRFAGPEVIDVDTDELWKLKNKSGGPEEGDLVKIRDILHESLTSSLQGRLGSTVVPDSELQAAQSSLPPSIGGGFQTLARKLQARFIVTGNIDRVEFDGNTVTPDDYVLTVSTRIIDPVTGQTVWSEELKKISIEAYTKKSGKPVMQIFAERLIPQVSDSLANSIAGALGR